MTPVIVIIIEPELEFDEVESGEAGTSILGRLSLLAGSADPCEEPPTNKKIARIEAKHRNLSTCLNLPSSHSRQGAVNCPDLFSQKNFLQRNTPSPNLTSVINVPSSHPGQDVSSHKDYPYHYQGKRLTS